MKTKNLITINRNFFWLVVFSTVILTGCSNKTDANKANFSAAISKYFEKNGDLCLTIRTWSTDVSKSIYKSSLESKMEALLSVGLVSVTEVDVVSQGTMEEMAPKGSTYRVKKYAVTEAGKKFYRVIEDKGMRFMGKKDATLGTL